MAVIGTFAPSKDGGWIGSIRTLVLDVRVHFVPNDDRESDNSPAFRVFVGDSEVGAAWHKRTSGNQPRDYLSVSLRDAALPASINAALFGIESSQAQLVWSDREVRIST